MAKGFKRGAVGGISLVNFNVKGYATEELLLAAKPSANTIGIITTTEISEKILSPIEPETPIEGMVWIITGTSSPNEFNALKENTLQVCPLSAKQYVDGEWKNVPAMSYKNVKWNDWRLWLIKDGIANGFNNFIRTGYEPAITQGDGFLTIYCELSKTSPIASDKKIDLTNYNTIEFDVDVLNIGKETNYANIVGCSVFLVPNSAYASLATLNSEIVATTCSTETGRQTINLDVSNIDGEYYISICTRASATSEGKMNVYNLVVK